MVVPYIGTWIETEKGRQTATPTRVVPYIGTWIETGSVVVDGRDKEVVPYIGTWIETWIRKYLRDFDESRTLYRYVD